jgi:citrate synthase
MTNLKDKLAEKIPGWREEIKALIKEHGDKVISQVTVAQAYGGQRGVKCLVCDTSVVDPDKGVTIRGYPIGDLTEKSPAEVFYLLCTGELPDEEAHAHLQQTLAARAEVPAYVWKVLYSLPRDTHEAGLLGAGPGGFGAAHRQASVHRRRRVPHPVRQGRADPARSGIGLGRQLCPDAGCG